MSDVFYLRPMDPPVSPADLPGMLDYAGGCFNLHRVEWIKSVLADDGTTMLCWYRAPDAESVRVALRTLGSDMNAVWPGRVLKLYGALEDVSTVVELDARSPEGSGLEQLLEQVLANNGGLKFVQGFELGGGEKTICLFDAADGALLQSAFERVGVSPAAVWCCRVMSPPGIGS